MSSKYDVISDVSTVASNSTNGMTLFNSSDKIDVGLGIASLGIGFAQTASLITASPETGHRAFSDKFLKGMGGLGVLVGGAATMKDGSDILGHYRQNKDWSKIPANEVFSMMGNGLATISAYTGTVAVTSAAASGAVVTAPVTAPTAAVSGTIATTTGVLSIAFAYLANKTPPEVTIGDVLKDTGKFLNDEIFSGKWITTGIEVGGGRIVEFTENMHAWSEYFSKNAKDIINNIFEGVKEFFGSFNFDFFDFNSQAFDWLPASFKEWFDMNRDGFHTFYDPLILDLDGNGISTFALDGGNFAKNAFFDFDGDGVSHATGWTTDGILVRDVNGDGIINNGTEVFGDSTLKQDGTKAKHGFDALSDFDSNADSKIDKLDALFDELKVWQDKNKDGISQIDELHTLTDLNIDSLDLNHNNANQNLQGGRLTQLSSYTKSDGKSHRMGDVDFNFSTTFSQYADRLDASEVSSAMDLAGRGKVRSLKEAMVKSDELKAIATNYQKADNKAEQMAMIDGLLSAWAKTDSTYQEYTHDIGVSQRSNRATQIFAPSMSQIIAGEHEKALQAFDDVKDKIGILDSLLGSTTQNLYYVGTQHLIQTTNTIKKSYESLREHAYAGLYPQSQNYHQFLALTDIGFDIDDGKMYLDLNRFSQHIEEQKLLSNKDGFVSVMEFLGQLRHSSQNNIMPIKHLEKVVHQISIVADDSQDSFNEWLQEVNSSLLNKLGHIGVSQRENIHNKTIVLAKEGDDSVYGTNTQDILFGGEGSDNLDANDGNDYLDGGNDNDRMSGGNGDDVLVGGAGNDHLNGGYGADIYLFTKGHGQDIIYDYQWSASQKDNPIIDVIKFADIDFDEVTVSIERGALALSGYHENDRLTIQRFMALGHQVEQFQFRDKTVSITELLTNKPIVASEYSESVNLLQWNVNLSIDGKEGDDNIATGWGDDGLFGGKGNDTLSSGLGDDHLEGGEGNDNLDADAGNDILIGGSGDDNLRGGYGADTYVFSSGHGHDVVFDQQWLSKDEVNPEDVVQFTDVRSDEISIRVERNNLILSGYRNGDQLTITSFQDKNYRIEKFEFIDQNLSLMDLLKGRLIQASQYNESINLSEWHADFSIDGKAGNDNIMTNRGNDNLSGDLGDDSLFSGSGDDILNGGVGNDHLNGGYGSDTYIFSKGHGQDVIYDDQHLNNNEVNPQDTIRFTDVESTEVSVSVENNRLVLSGYHDGDKIALHNFMGGSSYHIEQFEFSDKVINVLDLIKQKEIDSTQYNDYIDFSKWESNLSIHGGDGRDTITTGNYNDHLWGDTGNDSLSSNGGNDYLYGGQGDDTLTAGDGNDVLNGDIGNDTLNGGYGSDTYMISKGHGQDVIVDYQHFKNDEINPKDIIDFADVESNEVLLTTQNGHLILSGYHNGDRLTLQSFFSGENYHIEHFKFADKTMNVSELLIQNTIHATDSNDYLSLVSWNMDINVNGELGNDTIHAGKGDDTLLGGEGNDHLVANEGNDHLEGGTGNNHLNGGNGNDIFMVGLGQDTIMGGMGADIIKFIPDFDSLALHDTPILKIQDFNMAQGDKLDFSSLFENTQINRSNIFEHLSLENKNNHTILKLDKDGAGDEHVSQNFIDLGYHPKLQNMEQLLGNMVI